MTRLEFEIIPCYHRPMPVEEKEREIRRGTGWKGRVLLGAAVLYAAVFVTVSSLGLRVGFDYDDTLAFSTPSFMEAFSIYPDGIADDSIDSPAFWTEVNSAPERDIPKPLTVGVAVAARLLGFRVDVISARCDYGGEPVAEHWSWLVDNFHFSGEDKVSILANDRFVVFFGDSDSDIQAAMDAGIWGVRVERNPTSSYDRKYNPGSLGEPVIPFSEGPGREDDNGNS